MTVRPFEIARWLAGFLIFSSVLLPAALGGVKALILLTIVVLAAWSFSLRGVSFRIDYFAIPLIYSAVGLLWSLYGLIKGNPGAVRVLTVMSIYPMLMAYVGMLYRESDRIFLPRLFVFSAWAVVVLDLLYIGGKVSLGDNPLSLAIESLYVDVAVVDEQEDYFKFTIPNLSSVIFVFPFVLALFSFEKDRLRRIWYGVLLLLLALIVVLSGRRAIFVSMFVSVCVLLFSSFLLERGSGRVIRRKMYFTAGVLGVISYLMVNFYFGADFIIDQLASVLDFSGNESNRERAAQFGALMQGIERHPLLGVGAGGVASYLRSDEMPWAYELSYVAFVFHYGFLGFLIYLVGVLWLLFGLFRVVVARRVPGLELCFLVGMVAFMVANATNPYLVKFDYMWIIFIPYVVLRGSHSKGVYE